MDRRSRARGAFLGLAVGDALGMPTQMLSRERIAELVGRIDGFVDAPVENEISSGTSAGRVTDDTDQAVILAELLLAGDGVVDLREYAERLLAWQATMVRIGSADLLGPSTSRALEAFRNGASVEDTGRWGDTNGAAMRVTPIGIATPADDLERLVDAVAAVDRVTHNTGVANAGASAVAAAVSAAIDGADADAAASIGVAAARVGVRRGHYVAGADVAERIAWARDIIVGGGGLDEVVALVGTGVATQEAVPAAFALAAMYPFDPWQACLEAASLGGDTDTVGAMVGAMLGAVNGVDAFPTTAIETLRAANPDLDVLGLADRLLDLRDTRG